MRKLMVVVGTRPNFVKVTRFKEVAAARGGWELRLVHTGQHHDERMSTVFFEQFGLMPDDLLGIPGGTPNTRMAQIMLALEPVVLQHRPDVMLVVGDVDSTLAAALTANRTGTRLAHLESGLRNGDMDMPEEVNRILTDRIADLHLTTEASARENLLREGISAEGIHAVGNTMIDTLVAFDDRIALDPVLDVLGLGTGGHVLVTMHRPASVDHAAGLADMVELLSFVADTHKVVFPVHPRTAQRLEAAGLMERLKALPGMITCGPLDYFAFQKLVSTSAFVITDSGGIQEETTYRRIPCLTLRPSTERPITVTEGSNELVPFDQARLADAIDRIRSGAFKKGSIPMLWDGQATERVFVALEHFLRTP